MKRYKNNKINLKWFVLIIFVIVVIFSIPIAKAEISNNTSALNQRLITLLQQLIAILMQQVKELTKQLITQQQAINNLNNTVFQSTLIQLTTSTLNSTAQQPISPYFVAEISSDKDVIKNDGTDYATLTIITKLSNGQILPNKTVKINNQTYVSDSNGIIIYKTTPTRVWDRCGNDNQIFILITEDGNHNYSKSILIENVQPIQKGGGEF